MELDFAFIAEKAGIAKDDGKLFCFGAGFDAIVATGLPFPIALPPFSLVARFIVQPNEWNEIHTFQVEMENPKGEFTPRSEPKEIATIKNEYDESAPTGSIIVANMHITALNPGVYQFRLLVDGKLIKAIPLRVITAAADSTVPTP